MIKAELNINIESINTSANFTGEIYFSVGDSFFPEKNWDDFLNRILNWWLVELIDLLKKRTVTAELNFMDGPFEILISTNNKTDTWEFKMIEDRKKVQVYTKEVLRDHFLKSFITELNGLLSYYASQSISNQEIDKLKANFIRFQKLVNIL